MSIRCSYRGVCMCVLAHRVCCVRNTTFSVPRIIGTRCRRWFYKRRIVTWWVCVIPWRIRRRCYITVRCLAFGTIVCIRHRNLQRVGCLSAWWTRLLQLAGRIYDRRFLVVDWVTWDPSVDVAVLREFSGDGPKFPRNQLFQDFVAERILLLNRCCETNNR